MPSLNSLLKEYLSKEEIISLIDSYDVRTHDKNVLLVEFNKILCKDIFPYLIGRQEVSKVCGSGTVGFVVALENKKFNFDILKKQKEYPLFRIRESGLEIPKSLALKIQIFDTKEKYWEARVLREEFIMKKLSESKMLHKYIPKFYCGCSISMPLDNDIIWFRLTFMDLIESHYKTLLNFMEIKKVKIADIVYKEIEILVKKLWRFGISHNDLSLNNIFINVDNSKSADIKLIDFGLSTMIEKLDGDDETISNAYIKYFEGLDKVEQNGSNVEKLKELFSYVEN